MRRAVLILGGAVAIVAGPLAVAAPAGACPYGTTETRFPGVCTQGASGGNRAIAPAGPDVNQVTTPIGGGIPSVNGIPCTQEHLGTCIALTQNQ
jgi:hypothetical protein